MLRSFRAGNHKSIKGEAELLLMPAYDKSVPVVPVAAIFGANASGKSNLLDALRWMQGAVRGSFGSWEPGEGVPRTPFCLDPSGVGSASLYAVELIVANVRYMYGFRVDDEKVLEEWLYTYPHNRKRIIFERNGEQWTFGSTVTRAKADVLRDLTAPIALFLSVAARAELDEVSAVYHWFADSLRIVMSADAFRAREVTEFLSDSEGNQANFVSLLRAADLGIQDLQREDDRAKTTWAGIANLVKPEGVSDRSTSVARSSTTVAGRPPSPSDWWMLFDQQWERARAVSESMGPQLRFLHGEQNVSMKAGDQSRGTLAWLRLLVPALRALAAGSVLCVDEIDSSLNPRLSARLIELFRSSETNPRHAQLVFTTHDATLLGTSFGADILGRDEVWFVEKSASGETTLYSLSDFKPRKDENTERRYLGGSYGAVPDVSEHEFRRAVADWVKVA
jgi:hypothetical protein